MANHNFEILSKKIQQFVSDDRGQMTKRDALFIAAGISVVAGHAAPASVEAATQCVASSCSCVC